MEKRKWLGAMLGLAALLLQSPAALAQAWPNRTVKVVSVVPPGGAIDLLARIVADDAAKLAYNRGKG